MDTTLDLRPLVVDLDGTLIANDILMETASKFVSQNPGRAFDVVAWYRKGKARLKHELWNEAPVHAHLLNYHQDLLSWLREEKARGRILVLASASDIRAVQAIADQVGLFDLVLGSDGETNLRSEAKAEELVARFGERGFDYVGNSKQDLAVWNRAATAYVVGNSDRLVQAAQQRAGEVGQTFRVQSNERRHWLKALRPHQWVKNALIFLPLVTAQRFDDLTSVWHSVLAFISFCLAASSVYLLNDIADIENDREHPKKRHRPFAAGTLSLAGGWFAWPVIAAVAIALSFVVGPGFAFVLIWYLAATTAYSFYLKRIPVVDVLALAALYTIRIVAGAAAIEVALTMWLLAFSGFFFLSLALVKRVSELSRARLTEATAHGRGYRGEDLELLSSYGVSTSIAAALVFTLFVNDPTTAEMYDSPRLLWAAVPILLWWLMRVWLRAHRGTMNEDPIVFAIKDRLSIVAGAVILALFFVAATVTI